MPIHDTTPGVALHERTSIRCAVVHKRVNGYEWSTQCPSSATLAASQGRRYDRLTRNSDWPVPRSEYRMEQSPKMRWSHASHRVLSSALLSSEGTSWIEWPVTVPSEQRNSGFTLPTIRYIEMHCRCVQGTRLHSAFERSSHAHGSYAILFSTTSPSQYRDELCDTLNTLTKCRPVTPANSANSQCATTSHLIYLHGPTPPFSSSSARIISARELLGLSAD